MTTEGNNNQPDENMPIAYRVSTVTKYIKLYSDNPIHDCLDRIIDACEWIDSHELDSEYGLNELAAVSEELFILAYKESISFSLKRIYQTDEQKSNQA